MRRRTSFPNLATDLRNAGAQWVDEGFTRPKDQTLSSQNVR